MLKKNAEKLIDTLEQTGRGETRLILAALMTETLSKTDPISDYNLYLYRLCDCFEILGNPDRLDQIFTRNKNFTYKD
jgi:hypothetical protein